MPKLLIREGGKDSLYEIFDEEVAIGRGAANAVQISDSHASKQHAVVRRIQGRWKVIDFESKNGTRVNGQFRNQHWLQDGDTVTIGSATFRYEDEAARALPPRPVAAAPAARPVPVAVAPAPVAAPRAPAAPAVAARAPAPRPPPPAPSRPAPVRSSVSGGAPVSRRVRDDVDVDPETGRRYRRRGMSGPAVGLLIGMPVVLGIVLMFVFASGGTSTNQQVYNYASDLANHNQYKAAVDYAEKYGDPDGRDWDRLADEVKQWKRFVAAEPDRVREDAARKALEQIGLHTPVPNWRPKDAWSPEQIAQALRDFLQQYDGTIAANEMKNAATEPNISFRKALGATAPKGKSPEEWMQSTWNDASIDLSLKRFGAAIQRYETLKSTQQLQMDADSYAELRRKADAKIAEIESEARSQFDAAMAEAKRLSAAGQMPEARAKLSQIVNDFGIPDLAKQAKALLDTMR